MWYNRRNVIVLEIMMWHLWHLHVIKLNHNFKICLPVFTCVKNSRKCQYLISIFAWQVSLDLTVTDKFCSLLHTSLVTLSQILEITTLEDIGKHADEILQYLKTTIVLEPTESIRCVQQVLAIDLHWMFRETLI